MKKEEQNIIEENAFDFLDFLDVKELKELAYSNNKESFSDEDIARKFVNYAYKDVDNPPSGFTLCLMSLYPFIAQELYKRYRTILCEF